MPEECAVFGWVALARILGVSKRTCMRRKTELRSAGVILYMTRINSVGRRYKGMYFFPSILKAYLIKKDDIF